eukprot:g36285.t1
MLHFTADKLPAGMELTYRTSGKLFNLHHLQAKTKVTPTSIIASVFQQIHRVLRRQWYCSSTLRELVSGEVKHCSKVDQEQYWGKDKARIDPSQNGEWVGGGANSHYHNFHDIMVQAKDGDKLHGTAKVEKEAPQCFLTVSNAFVRSKAAIYREAALWFQEQFLSHGEEMFEENLGDDFPNGPQQGDSHIQLVDGLLYFVQHGGIAEVMACSVLWDAVKNAQINYRALANYPAFRTTPQSPASATYASQIINMDTTVTCGSTTYHVHGRDSSLTGTGPVLYLDPLASEGDIFETGNIKLLYFYSIAFRKHSLSLVATMAPNNQR